MGRIRLIARLAARDLRRRRGEAVLMLITIMAASATLTLGLVLHGVTSQPYAQTRAVTRGPDVVANVFPAGPDTGGATGPQPRVSARQLAALTALDHAPGVTGHSGPYPVTWALLRGHGIAAGAEVEGRDEAAAQLDQPKLTQGSWVRPGEVVIERSFADALGVGAGARITLNGRLFRVAGVAVTAAFAPYPLICFTGCFGTNQIAANQPGLVWVTRAAARSLATTAEPLTYFLNLKLAHPGSADAFVHAHTSMSQIAPGLLSWQGISQTDGIVVQKEQLVMMVASWLLCLLAVASVAVLVAGRVADQIRRVGLLKAVGATPGLVAVVFLAEYLALALVAGAAGLAVGWLVAPLLTSPGAGLLGTAGAPPMTLATVAVVAAVALAVAAVATIFPAVRAARTSTVPALADAARPPRRRGWLVAISARLPVSLLLALRLAGRRPRRALLSVFSVAVTVSGIVAVLIVHAHEDAGLGAASSLADPRTQRLNEVLMVFTVALVALAAVNALLITWAIVVDARRSSAVARSLGATPRQVSAGLSGAQVLPTLAGALLGIPGGIGLVEAVRNNGSGLTIPPAWWLAAVVIGTVAVMAALTMIPARIGARRSVASVLQAE
jgi:ABC-type lipoprotein release transport system permease subunit